MSCPGLDGYTPFLPHRFARESMRKKFQKWRGILSSAFPSASNPYWRALPLRRMKTLLAGTFFVTAVAGFAADLAQLNVRPLGRGLFWPVFIGTVAVGFLVC